MTRLRAAAAVVGGLVLAAIGGGLGIPHLAKVGASFTTLVGLTLLVAGLALAVWGAIALIRGAHRWGRLGMLLAVLAATYVIVPTIGVAVAATHVPRTDLGDATPTDVGLEYTDVHFRASDGVRLSGWYVPSRNGDAVVLLHGAGSTRTATLEHARGPRRPRVRGAAVRRTRSRAQRGPGHGLRVVRRP